MNSLLNYAFGTSSFILCSVVNCLKYFTITEDNTDVDVLVTVRVHIIQLISDTYDTISYTHCNVSHSFQCLLLLGDRL